MLSKAPSLQSARSEGERPEGEGWGGTNRQQQSKAASQQAHGTGVGEEQPQPGATHRSAKAKRADVTRVVSDWFNVLHITVTKKRVSVNFRSAFSTPTIVSSIESGRRPELKSVIILSVLNT